MVKEIKPYKVGIVLLDLLWSLLFEIAQDTKTGNKVKVYWQIFVK